MAIRYYATFDGKKETIPIDLETDGKGSYVISVEGERHEIDALRLEHGAVSMIIDGESYSVEFEEWQDEVKVLIEGQIVRLDVADERRRRLKMARAGFIAEGRQIVTAPMPGKVVKVLVAVGDEVTEGQGLVVVEAMKMENELRSPKAGKVVEVLAREGSPVEINAKLVIVE